MTYIPPHSYPKYEVWREVLVEDPFNWPTLYRMQTSIVSILNSVEVIMMMVKIVKNEKPICLELTIRVDDEASVTDVNIYFLSGQTLMTDQQIDICWHNRVTICFVIYFSFQSSTGTKIDVKFGDIFVDFCPTETFMKIWPIDHDNSWHNEDTRAGSY